MAKTKREFDGGNDADSDHNGGQNEDDGGGGGGGDRRWGMVVSYEDDGGSMRRDDGACDRETATDITDADHDANDGILVMAY